MTQQPSISLPEQFTNDPQVDPYAFLGFIRNQDGSITGQVEFPTFPASSDPNNALPILSKDVTLNEENKTWVRIFLPKRAVDSADINKLPLIVDFHGGGFVICSPASAFFNDYYTTITTEIPAVVISVEYQLAPEHRLPAAYDDCMECLYWIKSTNEEWLIKYADFSNCFLLGLSAGGNIAYNVGLRASSCVDDLKPLNIKGLILHQPFFGGNERSNSELKLVNDKSLPLCVTDVMWDLSLPIGADRDHEYCNPMVGIKHHLLDQIKRLGWKVLIKGSEGDPLSDRQIEFFGMLEENGLQVVGNFDEGGFHGVEVFIPDKAKAFSHFLRDVICSSNA